MESDSERKKVRSSCTACNGDTVNPVNFKRKWGEDELQIADQYAYLGAEISKDGSSNIHMRK